MAARMVTIHGTWSRTNTFRFEVYDWRQVLRRIVRRMGGSLEAILPQDQKDVEGERPGTKSGTFKAVIPIRTGGFLSSNKSGKVALHVLRAILERETCRPPTLRIDNTKTTVRTDFLAEPII